MKLMHIFTKKKPDVSRMERPDPIRLYIPEDKVEEFWRLCDADNAEKTGSSKYRLWSFVADIFPETKVGSWLIVHGYALRPCIIKKQDN